MMNRNLCPVAFAKWFSESICDKIKASLGVFHAVYSRVVPNRLSYKYCTLGYVFLRVPFLLFGCTQAKGRLEVY